MFNIRRNSAPFVIYGLMVFTVVFLELTAGNTVRISLSKSKREVKWKHFSFAKHAVSKDFLKEGSARFVPLSVNPFREILFVDKTITVQKAFFSYLLNSSL